MIELHAVSQSCPAPHSHLAAVQCHRSLLHHLLFIFFPQPIFSPAGAKIQTGDFPLVCSLFLPRDHQHPLYNMLPVKSCSKVGSMLKKCRDKRFAWKHSASLIISGGMIRPLVPICLPGFEVVSLFLYVAQFTGQHVHA